LHTYVVGKYVSYGDSESACGAGNEFSSPLASTEELTPYAVEILLQDANI